MCSHALSGIWQPPMLNIALDELPGRDAKEVAPRFGGPCEGQFHAVLELVSKTVGSACLIKCCPRPYAAGKGLVKQPTIQHDIHRTSGCLYLHATKQFFPMLRHFGEQLVEVGDAIAGEQSLSCRG